MEKYQVYGKNSRKGFDSLLVAKTFASKLARRIKSEVEISKWQEEKHGSSITAYTKVNASGIFFNFVKGLWVEEGYKLLEDGRIIKNS